MIERWKDIPGFNGRYQLNTEGKIRSVFLSGKTRELHPYIKKGSHGPHQIVVKLMDNSGKGKEYVLFSLMAKTFLGPVPKGCVPYHINGCQSENNIQNIAYISRSELGKLTGARSRRRLVAKINSLGEKVAVYSSAREAGRQNYISFQVIVDRCNEKRKNPIAADGYAYVWDDNAASMKRVLGKMGIINDVVFEY